MIKLMATDLKNIKVPLVGSFRKSHDELVNLYTYAKDTYTLLSPDTVDWDNPDDEFVRAEYDHDLSIAEIEARHLEALRDSDFIILHNPEGYVGTSATYELGFAKALGIPVVSTYPIADEILANFVMAADFLPYKDTGIENTPALYSSGEGVKALQRYYKRAAERRGWDKETAKDTLLLLTEELGELARAVRKHEKLSRDKAYDVDIAEELADVQLYLVHLANKTGIDLGDAVTAKEIENQRRFEQR